MAIKDFKLLSPGHAGVKPNFIFIETDDTVAEVQATGYLNKLRRENNLINEADMALVLTKETPNSSSSATYLFSISKSGTNYSLVDRQSGGSTDAIIDAVADLAALQAVDTSSFLNDKVIGVTDLKSFYIWDADSTQAASGNSVVVPTTGNGRWFRLADRLQDFAVTLSGTNSYTATFDEQLTADSLQDGSRVYMKATNANTGNVTVNVDANGVKKVLHANGDELANGEIPAGAWVHTIYNSAADGGSGAFELNTLILPRESNYLTRSSQPSLPSDFPLGSLTAGMLKHSVLAGVSTPATADGYLDFTPAEAPTTTGTGAAYLAATSQVLQLTNAYAAGFTLTVIPHTDNTGACTINFDGIGADNIKLPDGTDPAAGDLATGTVARLVHDGTNFQLMNPQVSVASSFAGVDSITFNPQSPPIAYSEGLLQYDDDEKSLAFYNDESDVTLNIGQESWVRVYNDSGAQIDNGKIVYISGAEGGGEDRPEVDLAQADAEATSKVLGVATHDIANAGYGWVTRFGLVRDLDTSSFTAGDVVYLSNSSAGDFTTTEPASPNFAVFMGVVVESDAATGKILVFPSNEASSGAAGDATQLTIPVRKDSAGTISAGELVYITGYNAGANVALVELADASSASTMPAIGFVTADVTNSSTVDAIVQGRVAGVVDTSSFSVGDTLYVSETAGAVTNTKPQGTALIQNIGTVARSNVSNGVIEAGGSGRSNDLPNLPSNNIWVGDENGVPQEQVYANQIKVNQVSHGLAVNDVIKYDGSSSYSKATADTAANAEVIGIVTDVADVDNFTVQMSGLVTTLSGLSDNTVYFLDPSTAGALTATEPTTAGQISRPVLIATSTTTGVILPYRGIEVGSDSGDIALLETQTASNDSEITFTNNIDSTYAYYEVELIDVLLVDDGANFEMQTSTDGGSTFDSGASDYAWMVAGNYGTTSLDSTDSADNSIVLNGTGRTIGSATGEGINGTIRISNPSAATPTNIKHSISFNGTSTAELSSLIGSARRLASADVNALRFFSSLGNIASGIFKLRGYK